MDRRRRAAPLGLEDLACSLAREHPSELAMRYGMSRKTAYKWIDRNERDAEDGLAERSRAQST